MAKTLYEKLFDAHVVYEAEGETPILYINRHLIHEVTSPQAFDGLRVAGRQVRQVSKTFGTMDHSISTQVRDVNKLEGQAKIQVLELAKNTKATGIQLFDMTTKEQGIVHVMGPEQGLTLPGMTIVCGDSHTATHGAFGALAFGIGTSEVEHVLATQTLKLKCVAKSHQALPQKILFLPLLVKPPWQAVQAMWWSSAVKRFVIFPWKAV